MQRAHDPHNFIIMARIHPLHFLSEGIYWLVSIITLKWPGLRRPTSCFIISKQRRTIAGELIDSKAVGATYMRLWMIHLWKSGKEVWFCRSNELLQNLSFLNQPVSSEKVDICQKMIYLLFRNQEGRVFHLWLAICFCCCQEVLLLRNYVFFFTVFELKWLLIDIFWILENWYTCTMEWLFCSMRRWIVIYVT